MICITHFYKFIKGRYNLNLLLGNQRASYNKSGLGYEPKNIIESFSITCHAYKTSKYKILKYNYCNKNDHVTLFWFVKKIHDCNITCSPTHFYKKNHENKNEKYACYFLFLQ